MFWQKLISRISLFRVNCVKSFKFPFGPVVKCDILSYLLPKIDRKLKQFFFSGKLVLVNKLKSMKNSFFEKCHLSTFATTCFKYILNVAIEKRFVVLFQGLKKTQSWIIANDKILEVNGHG